MNKKIKIKKENIFNLWLKNENDIEIEHIGVIWEENYASLIQKALDKEIPQKVTVIEGVSSQACPVCKSNVNWNYCSNCGQKLNY